MSLSQFHLTAHRLSSTKLSVQWKGKKSFLCLFCEMMSSTSSMLASNFLISICEPFSFRLLFVGALKECRLYFTIYSLFKVLDYVIYLLFISHSLTTECRKQSTRNERRFLHFFCFLSPHYLHSRPQLLSIQSSILIHSMNTGDKTARNTHTHKAV